MAISVPLSRGGVPADPSDLRQFVLDQAPREFYRRVVRRFQSAYKSAAAEGRKRFIDSIAHGYVPQLRHALIEEAMTALAVEFGDMTVRSRPNRTRTSFHVEVCSGRAVYTACGASTPYDRLDDAVFRKTLAENPQLAFPFYAADDAEAAKPDGAVWVAVVHCPSDQDSAQLGGLHLVVTDNTCSSVLARVDLLKEFMDLARPDEAAGETEPVIRLRAGVRRPKAEDEDNNDA